MNEDFYGTSSKIKELLLNNFYELMKIEQLFVFFCVTNFSFCLSFYHVLVLKLAVSIFIVSTLVVLFLFFFAFEFFLGKNILRKVLKAFLVVSLLKWINNTNKMFCAQVPSSFLLIYLFIFYNKTLFYLFTKFPGALINTWK